MTWETLRHLQPRIRKTFPTTPVFAPRSGGGESGIGAPIAVLYPSVSHHQQNSVPEGCLHTGFYDMLQKANVKLLGRISNSKTRQRIFERSREIAR